MGMGKRDKCGRVWWCTLIIPAAWEAEVERSRSKANQGKSGRSFLKNN
jgi:hypothetical protein